MTLRRAGSVARGRRAIRLLVGLLLLAGATLTQAGEVPLIPRVEPADDLRQVVLVPPAQRVPNLDGKLVDWPSDKPLATYREADLKTAGRSSLEPGQKAEVEVSFWARWDYRYLYVAAQVRDRSPALPDPGRGWAGADGRPEATLFQYDGVSVNLQPYPEVLASSRVLPPLPASLRGWYDTRFVMSPYRAGGQPRTLSEGSAYVATVSGEGYVVEGQIPWRSLGFSPEAGDQMAFCLHVVDASPDDKTPAQHFLWNVVPAASGAMWWRDQREGDVVASWGRLRLVNPAGWGASLLPDAAGASEDGELRFVGTVDVSAPGLKSAVVEVCEAETGRVARSLPLAQDLPGSSTYRLRGAVNVTGLGAGRYLLNLVGGAGQ